jgi:hypothetical protein
MEGVSMQQSAEASLRRLDVLAGEWEMESSIGGQVVGRSRARFEWAEAGAFLVQRADGEPAEVAPPEWVINSPFPLTTVIGMDDTTESFSMLYADSRDVFRIYQMSLHDGVWRLWREAPDFHQRFTGRFSADGDTITGAWEMSRDGSTWRPDFDVTYRKIG